MDTDEMINPATLAHPTLMLIRGVPGSGKSYLASRLRDKLGAENVVVLDPDATNYDSQEYKDFSKMMANNGIEEKFHPYRFLRHGAYNGIDNNKVVIWNQAFTNLDGFNKTIVNLQTYAEEHGSHLPLLVVEMSVTEPTARERVARREQEGGHAVPEEAFTRFLNDYRSFSEEGFNTVSVNGEDDVDTSAATVLAGLQDLWKQ